MDLPPRNCGMDQLTLNRGKDGLDITKRFCRRMICEGCAPFMFEDKLWGIEQVLTWSGGEKFWLVKAKAPSQQHAIKRQQERKHAKVITISTDELKYNISDLNLAPRNDKSLNLTINDILRTLRREVVPHEVKRVSSSRGWELPKRKDESINFINASDETRYSQVKRLEKFGYKLRDQLCEEEEDYLKRALFKDQLAEAERKDQEEALANGPFTYGLSEACINELRSKYPPRPNNPNPNELALPNKDQRKAFIQEAFPDSEWEIYDWM